MSVGPPLPCHDSPTVSNPNSPLPVKLSQESYKSPKYWLATQVDEVLTRNSPPRRSPQLAGSVAVHPSGTTTHVAEVRVEMKTRTSCAGVPALIAKLDHGPSLPSLFRNQRPSSDKFILLCAYQYWLGVMDTGAGMMVARGNRVEVTDTAKLAMTRQEIIRCRSVAMIPTRQKQSFRQWQTGKRARGYQ